MNEKQTCNSCLKEKLITDFAKSKNGRHRQCKMCVREYVRDHYKRNKQRYVANAAKRKEQLLQQIGAYKESKPCKDCGNYYPSYVMQFDHLDSKTKVDSVSALAFKNSRKQAELEIAKCDLVCANCHAIRTHNRRK